MLNQSKNSNVTILPRFHRGDMQMGAIINVKMKDLVKKKEYISNNVPSLVKT